MISQKSKHSFTSYVFGSCSNQIWSSRLSASSHQIEQNSSSSALLKPNWLLTDILAHNHFMRMRYKLIDMRMFWVSLTYKRKEQCSRLKSSIVSHFMSVNVFDELKAKYCNWQYTQCSLSLSSIKFSYYPISTTKISRQTERKKKRNE